MPTNRRVSAQAARDSPHVASVVLYTPMSNKVSLPGVCIVCAVQDVQNVYATAVRIGSNWISPCSNVFARVKHCNTLNDEPAGGLQSAAAIRQCGFGLLHVTLFSNNSSALLHVMIRLERSTLTEDWSTTQVVPSDMRHECGSGYKSLAF